MLPALSVALVRIVYEVFGVNPVNLLLVCHELPLFILYCTDFIPLLASVCLLTIVIVSVVIVAVGAVVVGLTLSILFIVILPTVFMFVPSVYMNFTVQLLLTVKAALYCVLLFVGLLPSVVYLVVNPVAVGNVTVTLPFVHVDGLILAVPTAPIVVVFALAVVDLPTFPRLCFALAL